MFWLGVVLKIKQLLTVKVPVLETSASNMREILTFILTNYRQPQSWVSFQVPWRYKECVMTRVHSEM